MVLRKVPIKHDLHNNRENTPEVEILIKIDQHSNILKLLGYMSGKSSRLLIYEYLENGSLDCWLHKNRTPPSPGRGLLDWPKRLHIAVGVARALSYMHHECCPPVVHNALKSSNILLDADFNAKIKKFGSARFLAKPTAEKKTSTSVSFGSKGPEYDHTTKEIEKTDVYHFGVILLELLTGKEPGYNKLEYKRKQSSLAELAGNIYDEAGDPPIDDALKKDVSEPMYLKQIKDVFELGVCCTMKPPTKRPSMKDVCRHLLRVVGVKNEEINGGHVASQSSSSLTKHENV